MTHTDLVKEISKEQGIKQDDVKKVLEGLNSAIVRAASNNDGKIPLAHTGYFKVRLAESKEGRNPQTGASIIIPARKVLSFVPSKTIKEAIN